MRNQYYSRAQAKEALEEHGRELSDPQKHAIRTSGEDFWVIIEDDGTRLVRFIEDEG